jgi:ubiquinone biosynthesis protein
MTSVSIRRYGQIFDVLVKYGFSYYLDELFPGFINTKKMTQDDFSSYSVHTRIRMALEELGPTFVKLGQLMSARTELFPPEMIRELSRLQDRVSVVPFDEVVPMLDEYVPDWWDVFSSVDQQPLAAASISRVHRVVMQDGTELASRGLKTFMVRIFQNGFYHGDLHTGNIRVSPKGDLVLLDFGVCGVLMKDTRKISA